VDEVDDLDEVDGVDRPWRPLPGGWSGTRRTASTTTKKTADLAIRRL